MGWRERKKRASFVLKKIPKIILFHKILLIGRQIYNAMISSTEIFYTSWKPFGSRVHQHPSVFYTWELSLALSLHLVIKDYDRGDKASCASPPHGKLSHSDLLLRCRNRVWSGGENKNMLNAVAEGGKSQGGEDRTWDFHPLVSLLTNKVTGPI